MEATMGEEGTDDRRCALCSCILDEGEGETEEGEEPCCGACSNDFAREEASEEAEEYALEHVRLTGEVDPALDVSDHRRWLGHGSGRPVHYRAEDKALRDAMRHSVTNYDALVRDLDRDDPVDRAHYNAIRARANELVEAALAKAGRPLIV